MAASSGDSAGDLAANDPMRAAVPEHRSEPRQGAIEVPELSLPVEPVEIPAGSVQLRPFEPAFDAHELHVATQDPLIRRYHRHARRIHTLDDALRTAQQWSEWGNGGYDWAVKDITTGRLLGRISLHGLDLSEGSAQIGYWVRADARGRGVASTALGAVTRFAHQGIGITRIDLFHAEENVASCRTAMRCGYDLSEVVQSSGVLAELSDDGEPEQTVTEHLHIHRS